MIKPKQFVQWYNKAADLREEISLYLKGINEMNISKLERIPGYDVRLHQHLEAVARSLEGVTLLMDQINCDIKSKKYIGDM